MLRCLLLCLALCLSTAPQRASAATATLDIGGAAVRLEVPEGYVRVSERSPQLLVFQQGMLPQSNRLVEALLTDADLAHLLSGSKTRDVAYQVQAMRGMETVVIDASQWSQLRSATIAQMGGLDMGQVLDTVERQANSTLDAATGGEAGIRFGDPSQPALYAIDDKDAVHFSMVLPVELQVAGKTTQGRVAAACVLTVVAERLVLLYAFQDIRQSDDEPQVRERVRVAVDALADATRRANAPGDVVEAVLEAPVEQD